jgi:hypothetical protein
LASDAKVGHLQATFKRLTTTRDASPKPSKI